jgi:hypothetical protein
MRQLVVALSLLLISTSLIYGQKTRFGQTPEKPNPADYVIKVHISATHIRNFCDHCVDVLLTDALLNGKKIELTGSAMNISGRSVLIIPGDYQARLTKDIHNTDSTVIRQEYDLLLPDGTVWNCFTSGISE